MFVLRTFLMLCAFLPAQTAVSQQPSSTVTVPFFADDGHGAPVNLGKADLTIIDNKQPAKSVVAIQSAKSLPLRIGVLIDGSASLARLYERSVQESLAFLNQTLEKHLDGKAFVITFNATVYGTEFMDRDALRKLKIDFVPGGGTALYDAVAFACMKRMKPDPAQPTLRVLVILSDGEDNQSHIRRDQTIAEAIKSGTIIFTVDTFHELPDQAGARVLEGYAKETGGRASLLLKRKAFPEVFSEIEGEIENVNTVTYVPADSGQAGRFHSLDLKAANKKVRLTAPRAYYLGETK